MIKRQAFTLIELLVVISIIALLISILLPALTKARFATKEVTCMTGQRQLAAGVLAYEVDENRLPMHVAEGGYTTLFPTAISFNTTPSDMRPLYVPYVNVNFFRCPFFDAEGLDWSEAALPAPVRIYTPYVIGAGYYRNHDKDDGWESRDKAWKRSQDVWYYNGEPFDILFCDQLMYRFDTAEMRVNHPTGKGDAFETYNLQQRQGAAPGFVGSYYQARYTDDHRSQYTANFISADGHGVNLRGNDERLRDIPTLGNLSINYLLPRR